MTPQEEKLHAYANKRGGTVQRTFEKTIPSNRSWDGQSHVRLFGVIEIDGQEIEMYWDTSSRVENGPPRGWKRSGFEEHTR